MERELQEDQGLHWGQRQACQHWLLPAAVHPWRLLQVVDLKISLLCRLTMLYLLISNDTVGVQPKHGGSGLGMR